MLRLDLESGRFSRTQELEFCQHSLDKFARGADYQSNGDEQVVQSELPNQPAASNKAAGHQQD